MTGSQGERMRERRKGDVEQVKSGDEEERKRERKSESKIELMRWRRREKRREGSEEWVGSEERGNRD